MIAWRMRNTPVERLECQHSAFHSLATEVSQMNESPMEPDQTDTISN